MASLKCEEEYRINRERSVSLNKRFKFAFWAAIIPSAGVLIPMTVYYCIRALALLAGAGAFFGQMLMNAAKDTNEKLPLSYTVPYLYIAFLFLIGGLSLVAFCFKLRKPHYVLIGFYAAGAVYGLVGLFKGSLEIPMGLYLLAYGGYGIWLQDYVLRLHKELDELSLKEGYPDFIYAINEPRPMANTSGMSYKKSDFQRRQRKENAAKGELMAVNEKVEMDELTMDTPLPKSTRKIDNMM